MLDHFVEMFSPMSERDRQVEALRALTDRDLADVVLLRDQIEAYVEGRIAAAV